MRRSFPIICFLVVVLFSYCHRDSLTERNIRNDLDDIRIWYEQTTGGYVPLNLSGDEYVPMIPDWESAVNFRRRGLTVYEFNLTGERVIEFISPSPERNKLALMQEYSFKPEERAVTRLIVLSDGYSDAVTFLMTVIPSEELPVERLVPEEWHYMDFPADFKGTVLFYSREGYFEHGWKYQEGEVTHSLTAFDSAEPDSQQEATSRTGIEYCWTEANYIFEYNCWYAYTAKDPDNGTYGCEMTKVYTVYSNVCEHLGGGGSYNNDPTNGPGAGSNNNNKRDTVISEALKKILVTDSVSLNKKQLKMLNDSLGKVLMDCVYKQVYNYLIQNGYKLKDVCMEYNMLGVASIKGGNILSFGADDFITPNNIRHEFIHMFQFAYDKDMAGGKYVGMMEFEQQLFQDILEYKKNKSENFNYKWACSYNTKGKLYINEEYIAWIAGMTNEGKQYPASIPKSEFKSWAAEFGKVTNSIYASNDYTVDYNIRIESLFNTIKTKCND